MKTIENHPPGEESVSSEIMVEMRGITKRFPGVVANDQIDLHLRKGEIHTLLGENGAGKTTLMNILSGMVQPDEGTILIQGQPAHIRSPRDALSHGIGMVYQHFTLVPPLSVLENIVLGYESRLFLDLPQAEKQLKAVMEETGFHINPASKVWYLSVGEQQRVEILKTLYRGSGILILDEPTSVLTPMEVEELFKTIKHLTTLGKSVIFITHKLEETIRISDRITVLKLGKKIFELELTDEVRGREIETRRAMEEIVQAMFGSAPVEHPGKKSRIPSTRPILEVKGITARNDMGFEILRDLSLSLHRGEILGMAGVDGNGQKELAEVMAGQRRITRGEIALEGTIITNRGSGFHARMGIAYLTDDRMGEGCVTNLTVAENMIAKRLSEAPFSSHSLLNKKAIDQHSTDLMREFKIKASGTSAPVRTLSGGNIQKLLLARELSTHPKVLVCNNPTHGLDLMTTQFIRDRIRLESERGTAVVLISSDLDEILELSDRVAVIYKGEILSVLPTAQDSREGIGKLMLGIRN
jgi:simple sugar transport system ATP-binding protein